MHIGHELKGKMISVRYEIIFKWIWHLSCFDFIEFL